MVESILKTINTLKNASNHLYKFLSASAWSSLSTRLIFAESTACWPHSNVVLFPPSREVASKHSYQTSLLSHAHFPFRICHLIMLKGISLFNLIML